MAEETKTEETQEKQPTFEELLATYVAPEEAERQLSEIAIQRAQVLRDVAMLQARIAEFDVVARVIARQRLNPAPEA